MNQMSKIRFLSFAVSRTNTKFTTAFAFQTPLLLLRQICQTAILPTDFCQTKPSTSWTRRRHDLRMQVDSKPEELDEIDRRLVQLRIEVEALKKEKDKASGERLEKRKLEIDRLGGGKAVTLTQIWQAEKAKLADAANAKEQLDIARTKLG